MSFNGWWVESRSKEVSAIIRDSGYFYLESRNFTNPDFTDYMVTKEEDLWPYSIKIVDKELTEW